MNLKNKKKEKENNPQNSYEEISEKKTSKLGYIFLIIMVVLIIGFGEVILSDVKKIPEKPVPPSSCISISIENLSIFRSICSRFNETDKTFGLDIKYNRIKPSLREITSFNMDIRANEHEIRFLENTMGGSKKDYDLSLQEKMAGEDAIIDMPEIKNKITESQSQINALRSENSLLREKRNTVILKIKDSVLSLQESYGETYEHYKVRNAWYKLKIFFLTFIFVVPFFVFSLYYYFRLKKKNSPYAVILTATTTAFSILFLQVVGVFLYDILLKAWLGMVFSIFWELPFVRYIVYYGSVILIIVLFGGTVYYIQKKVFDPKKVAARRMKDKKCPKCSFSVDSQYHFCPSCGLQLKEICKNCEKMKVRYLSHCPHCGEK
jgi:predicted RNA-binding Zn-ribbon protein involved in translation (DUF1610 family)